MSSILTTRRLVLQIFFLLCVPSAVAQAPPTELRYKLTAGDRLVYRETFDRESKSSDTTFHARVVFLNQVLIVDSAAGRSLVGVQRNRQSAELLEYHEHGTDTLAQQKPLFDQTMAKRPAHFSDTNLFSATGQSLLPPQVLREATSKLLYNLGEIMLLPVTAVQVGSEWELGAFGLRMKLEAFEPVGSESCAMFADTGNRKDTHLHFTFCPESGHMAKLAFEGQYLEFESTIREKVTFELLEGHHQESASVWIADTQAQLGALQAFIVGNTPLPDASVFDTVLKAGSTEAQALALATDYQRRVTPPREILQSLLHSPDAEVRRIAGWFQPAAVQQPSQPCPLPNAHHTREKPGTTLRFLAGPGSANTPYMIHVPPDYRGDQPFPLIVYLSGGGGLAFDGALSSGEAVRHAGYLNVVPQRGRANVVGHDHQRNGANTFAGSFAHLRYRHRPGLSGGLQQWGHRRHRAWDSLA